MPEEKLLEMMEEALDEHKILGTKESGNKLGTMCMLYLSRSAVEKNGGDLAGTMQEFDRSERAVNLFKNKEQ